MSLFINEIQRNLGVEVTGFVDDGTKSAIKNFQMRAGLKPTGLLEDETISKLASRCGIPIDNIDHDSSAIGTYSSDSSSFEFNFDFDGTTDLFESNTDIEIKERFLDDNEYCNEETEKSMIFLHHTAGWNNPFSTVKWWNNDQRGRVATEYVIGGKNITTHDTQHDGVIVHAIPNNGWAYHLGSYAKHGITREMVSNSIGIEICNFGWLREVNGSYFTYTGAEVDTSDVTTLDTEFRGYKYWHKYTDAQINALERLLKHLSIKHNIDIKKGLYELLANSIDDNTALSFNDSFMMFPSEGIWSHTHVRKDKTDIYPCPRLLDMIRNI